MSRRKFGSYFARWKFRELEKLAGKLEAKWRSEVLFLPERGDGEQYQGNQDNRKNRDSVYNKAGHFLREVQGNVVTIVMVSKSIKTHTLAIISFST